MNYKSAKISIVVFCSIFIVIGLIASVFAVGSFILYLPKTEELRSLGVPQIASAALLIPLPVGLLLILAGYAIMRGRLKQLNTFESMTYDWYKSTNPSCVGSGFVSCNSCGNKRINTRTLMNKTFHREHFCVQCGKSLYYSSEQN